eukprot:195067-Prymnesium_polylepis.1
MKPRIDEERRTRSPGLQNNFYDVPMDDFRRPHPMAGASAPPAPVPPAATPPPAPRVAARA